MDLKDLTPWRSRSSGTEHPLTAMHREMDQMFANMFDKARLPAAFTDRGFPVSLDVSETDEAVTIKADLPGLEEKDLDVSWDDGVLTIKGERKSETEEKDEKTHYHLIERSYGSFQRSLSLPANVDDGKIKAKFENGVLEIVAPKKPEAKKKQKKIDVKRAG